MVGAILVGGESSLTRLVETAISDNVTTDGSHIWNVTFGDYQRSIAVRRRIRRIRRRLYAYDTFNGIERVEQAHNDYLQVLSGRGNCRFNYRADFLFQLFRTGLKNYKTEKSLSARRCRRCISRLFCGSRSQLFRFRPAHNRGGGAVFNSDGVGCRQRQTVRGRCGKFFRSFAKKSGRIM